MEVELQEIRDFVAAVPPFDLLPEDVLNHLVRRLGIRYIRRGKSLPADADSSSSLFFIRQGSVSLYSSDDELLGMLAEGDLCTAFCAGEGNEFNEARATEDTLVYSIPCTVLFDIVEKHPEVGAFLKDTPHRRLKDAVKSSQLKSSQTATLMNTPVSALLSGDVIDIDHDSSIYDASVKMTEHGVSSLLIMAEGKLTGIITDRDIRSRCLAEGLSPEVPVRQIMTHDPIQMSSDSLAFDALMIMTQKNIHHLPVIDGSKALGIITATDLIRQEGKNVVYITRSVHRAESVEALAEVSKMIPELQLQIVSSGGSAEHVGRAVTAVSSAITRRLIEIAELKLGPPPVPYAWIAAGSQARREQSSHSDQDNGLIISDDMKPEDEEWFSALADFVCDGLDACEFVYCPGDAMAKNPHWRQPEKVWAKYFKKWINTPEPKALMLSCIFFDIRVIYGDKKLLKRIKKKAIKMTKNNQLFLAHMTANALQHRAPLGFFRDFVLIDDGEHKDALDLKHNGVVPIIDLARIYALAEGLDAVSTAERLKMAAGSPSLSKDGSANLLDAFEFIGELRIEHQAAQIRRGEKADNFLSPKQLSRLERAHLKDAFKVIQTMQESLSHRYHTGHIS
jgi:CBS domain-containing protein